LGYTYGTVGELVSFVVAQGSISHPQPVEHPKHAGTPANLVKAFDAKQADEPPSSEGGDNL